MKLSWLNTNMGTYKHYQAYMYDMNNMKQCKVKEREFRDSGSIANTKICFEVRATALRPRLHTEGFPLYVHTGLPTQGISTEDLTNTTRSTQLLSPTNTTSTQEARHNNNHLTLEEYGTKPNNNHLYTQRDRHKAKTTISITSILRGIPTNPNSSTITTTREG